MIQVNKNLRYEPIRILTFTTLYPNVMQQRHGIFVEQRLRKLVETGRVEADVIAPVPRFPFENTLFGRYARYAKIPGNELRGGLPVSHPRYLCIPKIGINLAPVLLAKAAASHFRKHIAMGNRIDLIDAHYFYPDGVAAVMLGRTLGIPVVVTARGTDINLFPKFKVPRKYIRWAAAHCKAIISVSNALRNRMVELGISAEKITTLRNGVNLDFFSPLEDRMILKKQYNINRPVILSVGNLIESKGHHLVLRALQHMPDAELVIIGNGSDYHKLLKLTNKLSLADRVKFIAEVSQEKLVDWYNIAEVLVLVSSREGMPNVILESLACGTPVVATPVGGIPEIMNPGETGVLCDEVDPRSLADAIHSVLRGVYDRSYIRKYAQNFSWNSIVTEQIDLFASLTGKLSE